MNLEGDKALIETGWSRKGCVHVCVCVCVCAPNCVWNQKPEQEPLAFYTLWCRSGDRCYRPLVQSSRVRRGGSAGFKGVYFVLLTLRLPKLMGIELWYWVQSDRMGLSPLGTPHVLNTWGQEEVFYTAMLSSQIISLPECKKDQRSKRETSMKTSMAIQKM